MSSCNSTTIDVMTELDDLFEDIEAIYPDFDRNVYLPIEVEPPVAQNHDDLVTWIHSAYEFLCRAVLSELGHEPHLQHGNISKDMHMIRSKGFLRFFADRIYSPEIFEAKIDPCRKIVNRIAYAEDDNDGFSMLRAPHGHLFKSAMTNFKILSSRLKILDYARIADRRLEILQLSCIDAPRLQAAVDTAQDILSGKTMKLTGKERTALQRLIYNAAGDHGVLPSCFFVKDVEKLTEHAFKGGSYGDVYKGKMGERFVAIKFPRFLWDQQKKEKRYRALCKEALIWRPLDHPNVSHFLGICRDNRCSSIGLVSPFKNNGDLLSYLPRNPDVDRITILEQVCSGLEYLHSYKPQVIHGDLKCANILVDDSGRPRIADFGLSRVADVAPSTASTGSRGTLPWQAPELVDPGKYGGDGRSNAKTDIYAYGMTCLEVFLEKPPFHDLSVWEIIAMAREGTALDRAIEVTKGCDWIQPILRGCCSASAKRRYRAEEIIREVFWSPSFLEIRRAPAVSGNLCIWKSDRARMV